MIAYSYVRFSSPEQARGDSFRRQTEAAADWCQRHGVTLDTTTTFHDLGRSAFTGSHRENPDRNALALFLKMVESGRIPKGSYLLLENLDRLTREHIQPALLLVLNLLQSGIKIVQLFPSEFIFDDKSDTMPVVMMMMELSRGHGESRMKSERLGKVWREKKRRAREQGEPMGNSLPAWLRLADGKIEIIPERAEIVRRIFDMAISGYGSRSIVRRLTEEGVEAIGDRPHWSLGYVSRILRERRVVGEFQPMKRVSKGRFVTDGEPVPGFFPAVVSEETWLAARDAVRKRGKIRGRMSTHINVFAGLLKNPIHGGTYQCATTTKRGGGRYRVIKSRAAAEGRAREASFPFPVFEELLLLRLKEIPEGEIARPHKINPVIALDSEHKEIRERIKKIEEELEGGGDSAALIRVLRRLEDREAEIASQLAEARAAETIPLAESWSEARGLIGLVEAAPSEAEKNEIRLRIRAAFRRTIEGIWLVIAPVEGKRDRFCFAQVRFLNSPVVRSYLLWHRSGHGNGSKTRGGEKDVISPPRRLEKMDLRRLDHAQQIADFLSVWEIR